MYSSPATPIATGRPPPSSTYTRLFASGRPIGISPAGASAPAGSRWIVLVTVVSVSPKTWISSQSSPRHVRSRSGSIRSPPTSTTRSDDGSRRPASPSSRTHSCQYAVGSSTTVTAARSSTRSSARGSSSSVPVTTTAAPLTRAGNTSSTTTSKPGEANWSIRSPAPSASTRPISSAYPVRLPCSTPAPFGRPVEPDV
jgi:hypothetical protein